jgi:DNA mismatch repair protein MutL
MDEMARPFFLITEREQLDRSKENDPAPCLVTGCKFVRHFENELLEQLGISISPFGGGTVLVSAYPAMLNNQNPAEMLRSVADQIVEGGKTLDQRDLVDELLHMISCKAAVKAGDRLSPEEITALLEHRELCQDAHHCPHGRPTSLVFSRDELDRRFKRI